MNATCIVCGKEFALTPYKEQKFKERGWATCGYKCQAEMTRRTLLETEGITNVKQRKDQKKKKKSCDMCGAEFETSGNGRTCDACHHVPCAICGKEMYLTGPKFTKFRNQGWVTCSKKCGAAMTKKHLMEREGISNVNERAEVKEKIRRTRLNDSEETKAKRAASLKESCSDPSVIEHRKATNMERYGVETVLLLPDNIEKAQMLAQTDNAKAKRALSRWAGHQKSYYQCKNCGKDVYVTPGQVGRHTFCSRECQKNYYRESRKCSVCGGTFEALKSSSITKCPLCRSAVHFETCAVCGSEFQLSPSQIGNLLTCPKCRGQFKRDDSYLELIVCEILDECEVDYVRHKRGLIGRKEIDFYIEGAGLCIEVNDAASHNSTIGYKSGLGEIKRPNYHLDKTNDVRALGMSLLHIWDWQLRDERILPILRSMIRAKLGKIDRRIYARKCTVIEISSNEAKAFVERNHLQGWESCSKSLALIFGNKIVSVMCFRGNELTRFCSELNTVVVGGFGKLLAAFDIDDISTFSFNDYSDGAIYKNNGFEKVGEVSPRYWWVKGDIVLSRRSCQKKEISKRFGKDYYDYEDKLDTRTEVELMSGLGFVQVYDSGKIKWRRKGR